MPVRLPLAVLVLLGGLTFSLVGVGLSGADGSGAVVRVDGPPVARHEHAPVSARQHALRVLSSWDRRRADAWADGDLRALRALYAPRAAAGSADVALLRRYLRRGLVVRDLRMQLLAVRVLAARPRVLLLVVTERLAGAHAVRVGDGTTRRLPGTSAVERRIVLRRVDGRWRVARVSAVG
ncbi:MAG TPA: hypothetical protein VGE14_13130 [Marmoricola sp.]